MPDFEPTRSFAYRFVRYTVLPEVTKVVATLGDEPFLLRKIAWPIIDRLLIKEQQAVRVHRAQSEGDDSMSSIVRFYVSFLAKGLNLFESLGGGYFRVHPEADVSENALVDAVIEIGDEEDAGEFEGWIYAFSFPSIVKTDGVFPIKIGKTVGDVETRVAEQAKGSASFEPPIILGRWKVKRVDPSELAIHFILKARNKWRDNAPGREWFDATVAEVESIINFVSSETIP